MVVSAARRTPAVRSPSPGPVRSVSVHSIQVGPVRSSRSTASGRRGRPTKRIKSVGGERLRKRVAPGPRTKSPGSRHRRRLGRTFPCARRRRRRARVSRQKNATRKVAARCRGGTTGTDCQGTDSGRSVVIRGPVSGDRVSRVSGVLEASDPWLRVWSPWGKRQGRVRAPRSGPRRRGSLWSTRRSRRRRSPGRLWSANSPGFTPTVLPRMPQRLAGLRSRTLRTGVRRQWVALIPRRPKTRLPRPVRATGSGPRRS